MMTFKVYSFQIYYVTNKFIYLLIGYLHPLNPYFGATVGRVANRIGNGRFQIDNQPYAVSKNRETFTLHGGFIGFDKVTSKQLYNLKL